MAAAEIRRCTIIQECAYDLRSFKWEPFTRTVHCLTGLVDLRIV